MGSWWQQRLHMTLCDAFFSCGPLPALPDCSTSTRAVKHKYLCIQLSKSMHHPEKRKRTKQNELRGGIRKALANFPPFFAKLLCRSLSGAKRSSPHPWPNTRANAVKSLKLPEDWPSVCHQTICSHPCLGTPTFHPPKKAGLQVIWHCYYYNYTNIWITSSAALFYFPCQGTSASRITAFFFSLFVWLLIQHWVPPGSLNINTNLWTAMCTVGAEGHGSLVFPAHSYQLFLFFWFKEILKLQEASYRIKPSHSRLLLLFSSFLYISLLMLLLSKHWDRSLRQIILSWQSKKSSVSQTSNTIIPNSIFPSPEVFPTQAIKYRPPYRLMLRERLIFQV